MARDILAGKLSSEENSDAPRDILSGKLGNETTDTASTLIDKTKDLSSNFLAGGVTSLAGNAPLGDDSLIDKVGQQVSSFLETPTIDRVNSAAIGGLPPLAGGARNPEDTLPFVMGTLGGIGGSFLGKPNIGAGIGVAAGDLQKQAIKKLKGDGEDISIQDSLALGALAIAGGKVTEAAFKAFGMSAQLIPERARVKLYDTTLEAINLGKKQLSINWGNAVTALTKKYPDRRINLAPVLKQLRNQFTKEADELIPQIKTAIGKNKRLQAAIDDPNKGIGFTLEEANKLKQAISAAVKPISKRAVKGDILPTERVALDIVDSFDDAITKNFPEMKDVRAAYSEGLKDFKLARKLVEPGETVESSILSKPQGLMGLGSTPLFKSTGGKLAVKDTLNRGTGNDKLFKSLQLAHNLNRTKDAVGRLTEIVFGGAAIRSLSQNE